MVMGQPGVGVTWGGRASLTRSWDGGRDPLLWLGPESRDRSQRSGVAEQSSLLP